MKLFLLRWISNTIALMLTAYLLPGVWFRKASACVWSALVLGLLNAFVRPILLFLTLPLNIATLGLFTIALNGAIFFSVGYIVPQLMISGYGWAVLGSIVFSIFSTLFSYLLHERREIKVGFRLWRI